MNQHEIQQTATYIEHTAERGYTNSLGAELNMMSGEDRKAVAAQIKAEQQKQPAELPKLDFYESGELKSYDKKDNVYHEHTEYDKDSQQRTSTHIDRWDGEKEDHKYNAKTGIESERTMTHADGTSVTDKFNQKGNFKSETIHNKDGTTDVYSDNKRHQLNHIKEDPQGHIVETENDDAGTHRKFHYDASGNLDQIDGRNGHWERGTDKDGQEQWINNSGKIWHGKMTVDEKGSLHYKSNYGHTNWEFTVDGKDVRGSTQR